MPLANFFAKGSRHVVLRGVRVTQLQDQSVTVDRVVHLDDESDSTEISFDYCVLATVSDKAVESTGHRADCSRRARHITFRRGRRKTHAQWTA